MAESEDDFDGVPILADSVMKTDAETALSVSTTSKNKRKREAEKLRKQKRRKENEIENDESHLVLKGGENGGLNTAIAKLDPSLIADYIGQKVRRFETDLSSVEWEDRNIPG